MPIFFVPVPFMVVREIVVIMSVLMAVVSIPFGSSVFIIPSALNLNAVFVTVCS